MTHPSRDPANLSYAAVVGATVTVALVTLLIVVADLTPAVKDWLKATFSHHWIGKGVIGIIIFFASGLAVASGRPKNEDELAKAVASLFLVTIAGMVVLTVFFGYEAFVK